MTKCSRPSCHCECKDQQVEIDGRIYCCQSCYDNCTDEECTCDKEDGCCQNKGHGHQCCQGHGHDHDQGHHCCCKDK